MPTHHEDRIKALEQVAEALANLAPSVTGLDQLHSDTVSNLAWHLKTRFSKNGHSLTYTDHNPIGKPVVTVENYMKWYGLWLVMPDGYVVEVAFPDEGRYDTLGPPYLDHAPNPKHVMAWCARMSYRLDERALEMMIGRWAREYDNWPGTDNPCETVG